MQDFMSADDELVNINVEDETAPLRQPETPERTSPQEKELDKLITQGFDNKSIKYTPGVKEYITAYIKRAVGINQNNASAVNTDPTNVGTGLSMEDYVERFFKSLDTNFKDTKTVTFSSFESQENNIGKFMRRGLELLGINWLSNKIAMERNLAYINSQILSPVKQDSKKVATELPQIELDPFPKTTTQNQDNMRQAEKDKILKTLNENRDTDTLPSKPSPTLINRFFSMFDKFRGRS